jgi:hypothetical protein
MDYKNVLSEILVMPYSVMVEQTGTSLDAALTAESDDIVPGRHVALDRVNEAVGRVTSGLEASAPQSLEILNAYKKRGREINSAGEIAIRTNEGFVMVPVKVSTYKLGSDKEDSIPYDVLEAACSEKRPALERARYKAVVGKSKKIPVVGRKVTVKISDDFPFSKSLRRGTNVEAIFYDAPTMPEAGPFVVYEMDDGWKKLTFSPYKGAYVTGIHGFYSDVRVFKPSLDLTEPFAAIYKDQLEDGNHVSPPEHCLRMVAAIPRLLVKTAQDLEAMTTAEAEALERTSVALDEIDVARWE